MFKFASKYFDEIKEGTVLIGLINEDGDGITQDREYEVVSTEMGTLCIYNDDGDMVSLNPSYAEMFAIKEEVDIEQLKLDAAKWNDPQTQADLELGRQVRGLIERLEVCSDFELVKWFRDQKVCEQSE